MHDAGLRPLRIQIVEDEPIVALDLRSGLEQLGYEVVGIAANEPEALSLADRQQPDLVLMDIHLDQGSDGIVAARRLRERRSVPIVFLTAYGEPETLKRAAQAAPYGYLLKPFELRELNATVRMAIARREEERKTEDAERRLRLALESGRLAVMELEPPSLLRWSGHEQVPELSHLADAASLGELQGGLDERGQQALHDLVQLGQPMDLVCAWEGGGLQRWLEFHARHFEHEGLIIGMVRDVSERVQHETRLRQAAVAFETTDEAILFLDAQQCVLSCNTAFCLLTGWDESEVKGMNPEQFLFARRHGDRPGPAEHGHWQGEVICRRRDGSSFPALEHFATVMDDQGRPGHHVLSFADISEIRNAQRELQHQALHDPLTGLGNRLALQQHLQVGALPGLALLFIDLDGFKGINDTLGHDRGDDLLKLVALRLKALLRQNDEALRLGGDEFVVLARDVKQAEDALFLAQKLIGAIAQPFALDGQQVYMTASVGVALHGLHAESAQGLMKAADAAMYRAKSRGRNRAAMFEAEMADLVSEQLQLEQGLRQALECGQLRLVWQPQVDLGSRALRGAEVLLRWRHPLLGEVSPTRFIPVAEDSGLISEIGAWVLDRACEQAAAWRRAGLGLARVAVNFSVRQFERDDVPALVAQALHRHGLPPSTLELELTESLFADGPEMRHALERLRGLGVGLALDDFGTGFSSLAQLARLSIDRLKIDRSFVNALGQPSQGQAVAVAIVRLAQSLGLELTAEGVETEQQREILLSMGAMDAQGWLFYRALETDMMQALLVERRNAAL